MKRLLYFFPYFLTNVGAIFFFTGWCFLAKDAYFETSLRPTFETYSWVFLALLIFSAPRYLIKGMVPDPFKGGLKSGFWFIAKVSFGWALGLWFLNWMTYKPPEELLGLYQIQLGFSSFYTVFCHYFWGRALKKSKKASP